jgi:hypothetical protein
MGAKGVPPAQRGCIIPKRKRYRFVVWLFLDLTPFPSLPFPSLPFPSGLFIDMLFNIKLKVKSSPLLFIILNN